MVEVVPARAIEFRAPEGLAVEIDGDDRGVLPQRIERGTQFLRMVVPA